MQEKLRGNLRNWWSLHYYIISSPILHKQCYILTQRCFVYNTSKKVLPYQCWIWICFTLFPKQERKTDISINCFSHSLSLQLFLHLLQLQCIQNKVVWLLLTNLTFVRRCWVKFDPAKSGIRKLWMNLFYTSSCSRSIRYRTLSVYFSSLLVLIYTLHESRTD